MHVRLVVLVLAPVLFARPALPQDSTLSGNRKDLPSRSFGPFVVDGVPARSTSANHHNDANSVELAIQKMHPVPPADRNREIYYRNKVEVSLDSGWLPINIPFPFDFMLNSEYEACADPLSCAAIGIWNSAER